MKHYAKQNNGSWEAACGCNCWIPDDLTDKKPLVKCKRCKGTDAFKEDS